MSIICTPKNYPLPTAIGSLIQKRNKNSTLTKKEDGCWEVSGKNLFVFKSWFLKLFPYPWDGAIFQMLNKLTFAPYKEEYSNFFIASDLPIKEITLPLANDLVLFIEELSSRFNMNQIEIIEGLLYQLRNTFIK